MNRAQLIGWSLLAAACDGAAGTDGTNGVDGVDGQNGVDGVDGIDGENGQNGVDGQDELVDPADANAYVGYFGPRPAAP